MSGDEAARVPQSLGLLAVTSSATASAARVEVEATVPLAGACFFAYRTTTCEARRDPRLERRGPIEAATIPEVDPMVGR